MHYSVCFILFLYSILIVESYVQIQSKNVDSKQVTESRKSNVIYCKYYASQEDRRARKKKGLAVERNDLERQKRHMMFRKADFFVGADSDSDYLDRRHFNDKTIKKDNPTESIEATTKAKTENNYKTNVTNSKPDRTTKVIPISNAEKGKTTTKIDINDMKIVFDDRRKLDTKSNAIKIDSIDKKYDGRNDIDADLTMKANHEFSEEEILPLHNPIPGNNVNIGSIKSNGKPTTKQLTTKGHVLDDSTSFESNSDNEYNSVELKLSEPWLQQWDMAIIPYYIDYKTYDTSLIEVILKAIDHLEKKTCIILRRINTLPTDKYSQENIRHIFITNPSGTRQCVHTNELKPRKGQQIVTFGYDCMSQGEILHELLHVLGFSHEHNRPDRDKFIDIAWDNIKPGYKSFFEKRQADPFIKYPYDYFSIQHYPEKYFSKNGKNTINSKKKNMKIGEGNDLSPLDVKKITTAYRNSCQKRTKYYLENTCRTVLNNPQPNNSTMNDGIRDYYKDRIWNLGIVNYELKNRDAFTIDEIEILQSVLNHIEESTCIEFRDLSTSIDLGKTQLKIPKYRRYLYSLSNDNATSNKDSNKKYGKTRRHTPYTLVLEKSKEKECKCPKPGKTMNNEIISVSEHCFSDVNVLLHLFGHILGLDHQENAHDRNSYLFIAWNELSPKIKERLKPELPLSAAAGFEYDYHSVMHMPWAAIDNGKFNVIYPIWSDGWAMGHSTGLSWTDVRKLSRLYKIECKRRKMLAKQVILHHKKDKEDIPFIVSLYK